MSCLLTSYSLAGEADVLAEQETFNPMNPLLSPIKSDQCQISLCNITAL